MKVLVTGATGFIGGNLVERLQTGGYSVRVLVRNKKKNFQGKIEVVTGDLRDYKSLKKATKGVDVAVNCAAALAYHKLPNQSYWEINVNGVANLVRACIANKVNRLVQISTVGIYGPTGPKPIDENAEPKFNDLYSETKLEGDKVVWQNMAKLPSVIIRPTIAYGPGDTRPVFLRLFRTIKSGLNIIIGSGSNRLHTIYIGNLIDGIILAMKKDSAVGKDFIIGDAKCPSMREIYRTIARVENKRNLEIHLPKWLALIAGEIAGIAKTVRFVSDDRAYKIDKAKKILGYKPKVGLHQGMVNTYEWYIQNKLV